MTCGFSYSHQSRTTPDVLITTHTSTTKAPVSFIEVKRTSLATHVYLKTDETAQALREAQILLEGCNEDH